MPRRHRRRPEEPRPAAGATRHEHVEDGWRVRQLTGASSTKTYRCPGCDQEILPGVAHVVAWPVDDWAGDETGENATQRRHWHTPCWRARRQRRPTPRRLR